MYSVFRWGKRFPPQKNALYFQYGRSCGKISDLANVLKDRAKQVSLLGFPPLTIKENAPVQWANCYSIEKTTGRFEA